MAHILEILTNAVNVGASIAILGLIAWLAVQLRRQGREVLISRLFLRQRETTRAVVTMLVGLLVFIASNILELIGDVYHLEWFVNEVVETIALFVMLGSITIVAAMLRLPVRTRDGPWGGTVRVEQP